MQSCLAYLRSSTSCSLLPLSKSHSLTDLEQTTKLIISIVCSFLLFPDSTPLPQLIPRLFPFFRHTITSVRHSVLKTLLVFLDLSTLDSSTWVDSRLYRLLFQNLLLEQRPEIRQTSQICFSKCLNLALRTPGSLQSLVGNVSPVLPTWFSLLRSPIGVPLNPSLFWSARESLAGAGVAVIHNVDKPVLNQDLALVSPEAILVGKVESAKALGSLMSIWPTQVSSSSSSALLLCLQRSSSRSLQLLDSTFSNFLEQDLSAFSALHRFLAATIIEEWASSSTATLDLPSSLLARVVPILQNAIAADLPSNVTELQPVLNRLRADCVALYNTLAQQGKVSSAKLPSIPESSEFTLSSAQQVEASYSALLPHLNLKPAAKKALLPQLEERYRKVESGIAYFESTKAKHERMVSAALGGALVALKAIPAKMTPLIRSVTNSIKVSQIPVTPRSPPRGPVA